MKRFMTRLMIAAAALAVIAGGALAQTTHLYKTEIPLTFRAGGTQMLPGAYEIRVTRNGSAPIVFVKNVDDLKQVILLPAQGKDAPTAWRKAGNPVIAFECVEHQCALRGLWNGDDRGTLAFNGPATHDTDKRMAQVTVELSKTE